MIGQSSWSMHYGECINKYDWPGIHQLHANSIMHVCSRMPLISAARLMHMEHANKWKMPKKRYRATSSRFIALHRRVLGACLWLLTCFRRTKETENKNATEKEKKKKLQSNSITHVCFAHAFDFCRVFDAFQPGDGRHVFEHFASYLHSCSEHAYV